MVLCPVCGALPERSDRSCSVCGAGIGWGFSAFSVDKALKKRAARDADGFSGAAKRKGESAFIRDGVLWCFFQQPGDFSGWCDAVAVDLHDADVDLACHGSVLVFRGGLHAARMRPCDAWPLASAADLPVYGRSSFAIGLYYEPDLLKELLDGGLAVRQPADA